MSSIIKLYTTSQLKAAPLIDMACLVDPLIPATGIVFLHAKFGSGKTVLSIEEAVAVASGTPLFGMPTHKGRVALIEVDMPEAVFRKRFQPRIDSLPDDIEIMWSFFPKAFDCLGQQFAHTQECQQLETIQKLLKPNLVIVDTLRKIYRGDEKEGQFPSQVYGLFQQMFPDAAIQFNAHDRKGSRDGLYAPSDEDFSGHQAWANDAQSVIHLSKTNDDEKRVQLAHTKSHYSDLYHSITLLISADGCYMTLLDQVRIDQVQAIIKAAPANIKKSDLDQQIAQALGVSTRTARRLREGLAKGVIKSGQP
jgi:RecA-family ATPase